MNRIEVLLARPQLGYAKTSFRSSENDGGDVRSQWLDEIHSVRDECKITVAAVQTDKIKRLVGPTLATPTKNILNTRIILQSKIINRFIRISFLS